MRKFLSPFNGRRSIDQTSFICLRKFYQHLIFPSGISAKQRNDEIAQLNATYVQMLPLRPSLQKCLKYICQTTPYRMLKEWTYEIEAEPFSEDQGTGPPDYTDVSL